MEHLSSREDYVELEKRKGCIWAYWLDYVHEMDFMSVSTSCFRRRADRQTSNVHPFIYLLRCSCTPLYSPACRCPILHCFRFYCPYL